MLRILVPLAVGTVFAVFVAVTLGATGGESTPPPVRTLKVEKQTVAPPKHLPPLRLPNISHEVRKLAKADRSVAVKQAVLSENVLRFWANHRWVLAPRYEKCWMVPWQRSCTVARASVRLHKALRERAAYLADRTIPNTDNWVRAMRYAQRPFPGTQSWLEFISNRECRSCWTTPGGFICNYQGSGACGPMQFMSGTFYGHADDARAYLNQRGFIVEPSVWDWHNPLGQALTAAYMRYTGQDNCHWCL